MNKEMGVSIMKEQIIITIGRESGSGGHAIAKKVADAMGIACYDRRIRGVTREQCGEDDF